MMLSMPIPPPPKGPERDMRAFMRYFADQPSGLRILVALHGLVLLGPSVLGATQFGFVGSQVGLAIGVAVIAIFWTFVLRSGRK
jgi:hypothetical protein